MGNVGFPPLLGLFIFGFAKVGYVSTANSLKRGGSPIYAPRPVCQVKVRAYRYFSWPTPHYRRAHTRVVFTTALGFLSFRHRSVDKIPVSIEWYIIHAGVCPDSKMENTIIMCCVNKKTLLLYLTYVGSAIRTLSLRASLSLTTFLFTSHALPRSFPITFVHFSLAFPNFPLLILLLSF